MRNPLTKLFWFTDTNRLDERADKHLIIHQTLAYGSLEDIKYLLQLYSKPTVKKTFLQGKKGWYDPRALAFVKIMLGIKHLDERNYVKKIT